MGMESCTLKLVEGKLLPCIYRCDYNQLENVGSHNYLLSFKFLVGKREKKKNVRYLLSFLGRSLLFWTSALSNFHWPTLTLCKILVNAISLCIISDIYEYILAVFAFMSDLFCNGFNYLDYGLHGKYSTVIKLSFSFPFWFILLFHQDQLSNQS